MKKKILCWIFSFWVVHLLINLLIDNNNIDEFSERKHLNRAYNYTKYKRRRKFFIAVNLYILFKISLKVFKKISKKTTTLKCMASLSMILMAYKLNTIYLSINAGCIFWRFCKKHFFKFFFSFHQHYVIMSRYLTDPV